MKIIWILNHYAGPPSICTGLRHYNFAKYLIKKGYSVTVFASSAIHNSDKNLISGKMSYIVDDSEGVPFVYIHTDQYKGNKLSRIKNMWQYYIGVMRNAKHFPKPDVILGSSVHPLACLAAINLSKKYHCRNIVEIRDLWPESFVAFGVIKRNNPLMKLLYAGEKWLYRKAHKLVFTIQGGRQYILDKKWGNVVSPDKITHINNGIDLEQFDQNIALYPNNDALLATPDIFKIIYTGSIRQADGVGMIVETAKYLKNENIQIFIYGDGTEREYLEEVSPPNVHFKGKVDKNKVPGILAAVDLTWLHIAEQDVFHYGSSKNKTFEYLAAGKPVLSDIGDPYDVVKQYNAGVIVEKQSPELLAAAIRKIAALPEEDLATMGKNARKAAELYDFSALTDRLIEIIES